MAQSDDLRVHCPFGCRRASESGESDFDERGYCRHLVGFTNDCKVFEPIEQIMAQVLDEDNKPVFDANGKPVMGKTGRVRVVGGFRRKPVPRDAVLVNPIKRQLGYERVWEDAKEWVSYRVYLNGPEQQKRDDGPTAEMIANQYRLERMRAELLEAEDNAKQEDLRRKGTDRKAAKEFFGDDAAPSDDELEQLTRPGTATAAK